MTVAPGLSDYGGIWPRLDDPAPYGAHVFQSAELLQAWGDTIGVARQVTPCFIHVATAAGAPLLLVPMGIESRRGVRILTFLDAGIADYNVPVVFPGAGGIDAARMQRLWGQICAALPPFDLAILEKVPASVGATPNPFRFLAPMSSSPSGHLLALGGDWDAFVASRLRRRQDSRRKRRRLAEVGAIALHVARTEEEAAPLFAAMVRQKRRRFMETRGVDGFERPGYAAYFRLMTDRLLASGHVHLAGLLAGDDIVATHWGLVAWERFYFLMPTYEADKWARYSPGRLLIEELIAWCYRHGLRQFDFGVGDMEYKNDFGATAVPLFRGLLPRTAAGHAYASWLRLRRAAGATAPGQLVRRARDRGRVARASRSSDARSRST